MNFTTHSPMPIPPAFNVASLFAMTKHKHDDITRVPRNLKKKENKEERKEWYGRKRKRKNKITKARNEKIKKGEKERKK